MNPELENTLNKVWKDHCIKCNMAPRQLSKCEGCGINKLLKRLD